MNGNYEMIVIGGSAGSLPAITGILSGLPDKLDIPVIIVLHRLKNVQSEMCRLLSVKKKITEPEDKDRIVPGHIYLAPQNYHLMVEEDHTFMLDYSELVNFSRPSIDMTFSNLAMVYGHRVLGVLLSGANKDGAEGLCHIVDKGGTGIVQDPSTAEFDIMPLAAIAMCKNVSVMRVEEIIQHIKSKT